MDRPCQLLQLENVHVCLSYPVIHTVIQTTIKYIPILCIYAYKNKNNKLNDEWGLKGSFNPYLALIFSIFWLLNCYKVRIAIIFSLKIDSLKCLLY